MPTYDQLGYSAQQVAALIANDEARARQAKFTFGMTSPLLGGGVGPLPPGFGGPPGGGLPLGGGGTPLGGGLQGIGAAACQLVPAGAARNICLAGAGLLPGGGGRPGGGTPLQGPTPTCPPGTSMVLGQCVDLSAILPGGKPFTQGPGGTPVAGAFGLPGFSPVVVAQPVRRCPAGFALAKDGVCYVRSLIPRKFRAHPPGKRPPLTGADAAALRRIGSLQKRVQGLAKIAGLRPMTVAKRTTRKRK